MSHPQDPLNILNADQHRELSEIQQYLNQHGKTGFATMPERTVAAVLNRASPTVRQFMKNNRDFVMDLDERGGRYRPFQERIDLSAAVTPDIKPVIERELTEDLTHGLNARMGTTTPDEPTSLRDIVSASMEAHEND